MRFVHLAHAMRGVAVIVFIVATPVRAQTFGCAVGSAATDSSASAFIAKLLGSVQYAWSGPANTPNAAKKIDPLAPSPTPGTPPNPDIGSGDQVKSCSDAGTACFFHTGYTNCSSSHTHYNISNYAGLSNVSITALDVGAFNSKDVATHGAWGPYAGMATDGVFAPEGTEWDSEFYAVILPSAGQAYAVTVDLGSSMTICGTNACGPYVQADRHNMELDWWDETNKVWRVWGGTCESSGSGLIARPVIPSSTPGSVKCGSTNTSGSNFTARYVRLWALPGADDSNFSVSEIQLRDGTTGNNSNAKIVSTGAVAIGPRPYLINDGNKPKDGTAWNDTTYAVVLRDAGPGNALAIDLGGRINLCVAGNCVPGIQADKNVYQVDYSLDGTTWVPYGQLPAASSTGLQTRSVVPTSATAAKGSNGVTAQYVRIWGCAPSECPASGDTNFSVSEMTFMNTSGQNVSLSPDVSDNATFSASAFGPERVATNGQPPADSSNLNWDDPRFTNVLSPCVSNAAQKCVQLGTAPPTTGPLFVDLTATFPISGIDFQGDRHPFQIDYLDESSTPPAWKALWTIPHSLASGLSTRTTAFTTSPLIQARYLMVYGTLDSNEPDNHYSVSSLRVFTKTANTACGYNSAANYNQSFACSYDAPVAAQVGVPQGLSVSFTIDNASTYLDCYDPGLPGGASWTALKYPDGTTCTAILTVQTQPGGGYCSGSCSTGGFVATNVNLEVPDLNAVPPDPPTFSLNSLNCDHSVQNEDSNLIPTSKVDDFTNGLITFVQQVAAEAVLGLFNGVVVNTGLPVHVPSGACTTTLETPNTKLNGSATQVGSNDDNGHVRLSGEADLAASMRLDALVFTLEKVLFEAGGVEELVRTGRRTAFAPLRLELQNGSTPDRAVYATAPSRVPNATAVLSRTKAGTMAFDIQIDRARMPTLPSCGGAPLAAELTTRFTLDDGTNSTTVRARQSWLCKSNQLRTS